MPFETAAVLSVTINGVRYEQASTITSDSTELKSASVPAAKSGSVTTRTDDNTGVITMSAGHGFTTGQKVDVFWTGGSRRGMDATVATNAVTVDGGNGDVLPALSTAITAMVPTSVPMAFAGDDLDALSVGCPTAVSGWAVFKNSGGTVLASYQIPSGTRAKTWATGLGITNPLAGATVATVEFSHGATSAQEMTASVVF